MKEIFEVCSSKMVANLSLLLKVAAHGKQASHFAITTSFAAVLETQCLVANDCFSLSDWKYPVTGISPGYLSQACGQPFLQ